MTARHALLAGLLLLGTVPGMGATDLTGTITGAGGKPLAGARVSISTARVKEGTSPLCPSCYPDCAKYALTDATGRFTLPALDDALLVNVLVLAPGHRPKLVKKVDPATGPLAVALPAKNPDASPVVIRGRVVNDRGNPVPGAEVSVKQFCFKDDRTPHTSSFPGERITVTGADGTFTLLSKNTGIGTVRFEVDAPGYTKCFSNYMEPNAASEDIVVQDGAVLRGKVLREGKPVPGVEVGACQPDRSIGRFFGEFITATDADGSYEFPHLPPDTVYVVYGKRDNLPTGMATRNATVKTGPNGSVVQASDLNLVATRPVRGTVSLTNGKTVPPHTRLLVSRVDAWDSQFITLDEQGGFTTEGIDGEELGLSVHLPGYEYLSSAYGAPTKCRVAADMGPVTVRLRPDDSPIGAVRVSLLTPEGKPAVGAMAVMAPPGSNVQFPEGRIIVSAGARLQRPPSEADPTGTVYVASPSPPSEGTSLLVVLHESGYALTPFASIAENDRVKLTPYARVTGQAFAGQEPLAGYEVRLTTSGSRTDDAPAIYRQVSARTDAEGRFTIANAFGDIGGIGVVNDNNGYRWTLRQQRQIELTPGQTAEVVLGGSGITVTGRFDIPESIRGDIDWDKTHAELRSRRNYALPEAPQGLSARERRRWYAKQYDSPESRQRRLQELEYNTAIQQDGSFVFHDVLPGDYWVHAQFIRSPEASVIRQMEEAGQGGAEITVAADATALEIPPLPVKAAPKPLRPGVTIPDFKAVTLDGKTLRRADFAGAPAILRFDWITAEASHDDDLEMQQFLQSIDPARRPRVAAFYLANTEDEARRYAASAPIPWPQCYTGRYGESALFGAFRIDTPPTYVFIDAEGHVLGLTQRVSDLKPLLALIESATAAK